MDAEWQTLLAENPAELQVQKFPEKHPEYVSGLSRITAGNGPGRVRGLDTAEKYLRVTNALVDSGVASVQAIHLRVLRVGELSELDDQPFPQSVGGETETSFIGAVLDHSE